MKTQLSFEDLRDLEIAFNHIKNFGPKTPLSGLCYNMEHFKLTDQFSPRGERTLKGAFALLMDEMGLSPFYPVKTDDNDPEEEYHLAKNEAYTMHFTSDDALTWEQSPLWSKDSAYGRARWQLIDDALAFISLRIGEGEFK